MFLQQKTDNEMIETLYLNKLFDPSADTLTARFQHGEEALDPEEFKKSSLQFLSGEDLPACWSGSHYAITNLNVRRYSKCL